MPLQPQRAEHLHQLPADIARVQFPAQPCDLHRQRGSTAGRIPGGGIPRGAAGGDRVDARMPAEIAVLLQQGRAHQRRTDFIEPGSQAIAAIACLRQVDYRAMPIPHDPRPAEALRIQVGPRQQVPSDGSEYEQDGGKPSCPPSPSLQLLPYAHRSGFKNANHGIPGIHGSRAVPCCR